MTPRPAGTIGPGAVADLIRTSIAQRRPFSFVRLGDGEGALSAFGEGARPEDVAYLEKHFGPHVRAGQIEQIRLNLEEAIASADLIGVRDDVLNASPKAAKLEPDEQTFFEQFKALFPLREVERRRISLHSARRIFQLYQRVCKGLPAQAEICSQWVCYDLARDGFWESLLSGINHIGIVTSSSTLQARLSRRFDLRVDAFVVPPKHVDRNCAVDRESDWHYPDGYRRVRSQFERSLEGRVFLVGAGLVGKHYLHLIKKNGGIALDVGALLDAWEGQAKRGVIYSTTTPLQASPFCAPATYRLGAGRLTGNRKRTKPSLVVHGGFSRTAATTIQTAFARHQEAFFEIGVNYLKVARGNLVKDGREKSINHHDLARAFGMGEAELSADPERLNRLLTDIAVETASRPDMVHVISSELFTNTSPNRETEDDLIEFLNSYDVKFVVMVRNQFDWLSSWASSNVNIDVPLNQFLLKPARLEKFDGNFLRKIDWFEKYLPKGAVRVLSYEEHRMDPLGGVTAAAEIPKLQIGLRNENSCPSPDGTISQIVASASDLSIDEMKATPRPPNLADELAVLNRHQEKREMLKREVMRRFIRVNDALHERYGLRIGDASDLS